MRLNKFLARATGLSRRAADAAIEQGRVTVSGGPARLGDIVRDGDTVQLDRCEVELSRQATYIMLNKPPGYVCSRNGQGSPTIYELLPSQYHRLKPVGRLDKDSSGLLLLTDDGDLANRLTHPRHAKTKLYEVDLSAPLAPADRQLISEQGVRLDDGLSRLDLEKRDEAGLQWLVTMHEGRNRQIRRTFATLKYDIVALHRTRFGDYRLNDLPPGQYQLVQTV